MKYICFLEFGNAAKPEAGSIIKLKKTNISHLLTLDLKKSEPKHGFRFILVTLYNDTVEDNYGPYIFSLQMNMIASKNLQRVSPRRCTIKTET
jgi:hypothetical protein